MSPIGARRHLISVINEADGEVYRQVRRRARPLRDRCRRSGRCSRRRLDRGGPHVHLAVVALGDEPSCVPLSGRPQRVPPDRAEPPASRRPRGARRRSRVLPDYYDPEVRPEVRVRGRRARPALPGRLRPDLLGRPPARGDRHPARRQQPHRCGATSTPAIAASRGASMTELANEIRKAVHRARGPRPDGPVHRVHRFPRPGEPAGRPPAPASRACWWAPAWSRCWRSSPACS